MRKLYDEYFYIPKGGKIREKVLLARVATTIVIVVLCLAAMGFTAYAYFSDSLTSGSNKVAAANFDVKIEMEAEDGSSVEIPLIGKAYKASLEAGKTYEVTLKIAENSKASTGFVVITAENCDDKYYTTRLCRDEDGKPLPLTFKLTASEATTVSFLVNWGTPSYYDEDTDQEYLVEEQREIKLTIDTPAEEPEDQTSAPEGGDESSVETSEPTGPEESSVPETSEPSETSEPETSEPETSEPETSEPETPGDESTEQTDPGTEDPEAPDESIDEPLDGPLDEPGE